MYSTLPVAVAVATSTPLRVARSLEVEAVARLQADRLASREHRLAQLVEDPEVQLALVTLAMVEPGAATQRHSAPRLVEALAQRPSTLPVRLLREAHLHGVQVAEVALVGST